ncbi:uncharacterized protein LOC128206949 [Mya arenaria]|uniref:uncharacterized protein LOC128206949 n=1 Tax=Mya arenaria TaxID=6604 RepID=UPI0022DEF459|nr:uncharacterized protein LOC128206949 [Mya arenaria]
MDSRHDDSTLTNAMIGLSSTTGTAFVSFVVGCFIFMKLRSPKANPRKNANHSEHVNQANDQGNDISSSRVNLKASAEISSYSTLQIYENTTLREPYKPVQIAGDS